MTATKEPASEYRGTDKKPKSIGVKVLIVFFRVLLPLLIIAGGIFYTKHLIDTSPKSKRQPPARQARLVEITHAEQGDFIAEIHAMGTVIPARSVDLRPQVSGKLIEIDPGLIPGGLFKAGQPLMKIESADYELQVRQRETDVATAQNNLKIELGNQAVAQQEYELLGDVVKDEDKDLVLRRPQLAILQSQLEAAQAQLDLAKLNLERTRIIAPFNAIVQEKYVELGATVSPTTLLVTLTGTDEYWIELQVPVDQLKWIAIGRDDSQAGSSVKIYNPTVWTDGGCREGRVLRLSSDLETSGRMAQLLVTVKDPLGLAKNKTNTDPLLIGSYIRAVIEGQPIPSVIKLNRELLRDGDKVWLYTTDNTLKIQPITIVFRTEKYVLVSEGISPEDRLVVTDISAAVDGMALRLPDSSMLQEIK